jgi:hypothetical protein
MVIGSYQIMRLPAGQEELIGLPSASVQGVDFGAQSPVRSPSPRGFSHRLARISHSREYAGADLAGLRHRAREDQAGGTTAAFRSCGAIATGWAALSW